MLDKLHGGGLDDLAANPGPENTRKTLEIAVKRAQEDGLPLVIASNTGATVYTALELGQIQNRWSASPTA